MYETDPSAVAEHTRSINVSQKGDRERTLVWSGGSEDDPLDGKCWTLVDDDGGFLLDELEGDRWQAAAFRTLARGGTPDADA